METTDELVERAEALLPLLREQAAKTEEDRRVPDEVIDALGAAGLFRLSVPKRYGGLGTDMRTMLEVSAKVAEGDGSTAWVVTLINVCNWLTSLFPAQAQEEVFADPQVKVSGVLTPSSSARRVEGGWRVSGRWFYNSGSWHATWAVLGVPLTDDSGEVVDQALVLVPRADFEIEDVWFVAGMRGTGSNCLIVGDVFVPEHRVLSVPSAIEGDYGTQHTDELLYRAAFVPVLALVLAAPQIGLGRAALRYVTERAGRKAISYTFYETQAESTAFQLQIAEAANRIDTAYLHAVRAASDIDSFAERGEYPPTLLRARVRSDTGVAVQNVVAAIQTLLDAHGAGSFAEVNPLQRIWRDANVAARHAVAVPQIGFEVYGKALLGVDDQITPLI
ncbi:acyl-CoA dehydrogenase family protein [Nonomuraea guangzhouensis]|uniref:Acyl-CoA dehydrogenase family protein n=1 Tax=Nonomuraea guangzhouensis TaxID=1291555 RepID=A0ABW4G9H8_9ACTN|nr:acyl-CoA dehydrogenase family protein [Nonomuraea guangzhouensis]